MRMLRSIDCAWLWRSRSPRLTALGAAQAQTKITVGKIIGGSGFHIPSYVAMDQGFFKAEGLDASFITLHGRALVTAGLTGSVDFIPIPSGGSQAALSGAEIRYVVGESLKSQWLIVARPNINKPEDLKGKTIGYGRAGSADYDEGAAVMLRAFKMEVGKDYKVISFQGEPRAGRGAGQRRHRGGADFGAARAAGARRRHENPGADRRLHPARRRHVLDAQGLSSTRIPRR